MIGTTGASVHGSFPSPVENAAVGAGDGFLLRRANETVAADAAGGEPTFARHTTQLGSDLHRDHHEEYGSHAPEDEKHEELIE